MKKVINSLKTAAILWLLPISANAASAQENRENLIVMMFSFTQVLAFIVGAYLMISFFLTMKRHADAPNDQSASVSRLILILLTATLLLNLNGGINLMTATITGTESYCFGLNKDLSETNGSKACFDPNSSDVTEEIRKRIDPDSTSTKDLMNYISLVMGLIQFLGLVFFIKAILMIRQIGQGQGAAGPGKVIIALIFSALIIDLPHTLDILSETIKSLGVTL